MSNLIGGIANSVAGGTVMGGELGVQSAKNIAQTQKNWAKVREEIKGDARQEKLFDLLTDVDMDYNPVYPESRNRDLVIMGYGSKEIRDMRDRLAGLEVNDGIDKDQSVGYQLYQRGQELTGAAQSGLSPAARTAQGIVTSAAENLAVAAVNPAAVLPVLSLQGASDAMGQSIGEGESAGKVLGEGALKFGAGWAINSVGVADLAKTMGSAYAKDSVAGQVAEWVRKVSSSEALQEQYPAVANAISGGIDNAMQAFVETYADKAVDAALGDSDAAKNMLTADTFLEALESGLTGGASGALGGAAGTGIAAMTGGGSLRERVEAADMEQKAANTDSGLALSGAARQLSQRESPWQDGKTVLDEQSPMNREAAGAATKGNQMDRTVENTGESVDKPLSHAARDSSPNEGSPWQDGGAVLDEEGPAGRKVPGAATEESNILQETYGLRGPQSEAVRQDRVKQQLEQWGVDGTKTKAAQEISAKLPGGMDTERYAAAASTLPCQAERVQPARNGTGRPDQRGERPAAGGE